MDAQEKFQTSNSSPRFVTSSSYSMYDLNHYATESRSDAVRPITGRSSQASSMTSSPSWQQFDHSANANSSLLLQAMSSAFKSPAPIQKPASKPVISLDAFQTPHQNSSASNQQQLANSQQLLNYYYAQLQQQQQQQRQAALIQQQLQYQQQLQQQQRLLWEQRYSSMMAPRSSMMPRSATTDALGASSAATSSTFADYAMLSSLAAAAAAAASATANPAAATAGNQLTRSNTLFTSRNNNI